MKLDYLKIGNVEGSKNGHFKNLRDFEVDFDENPKELVTVLLGRNGSGKSNLLEALVIIFRDLYLGKDLTSFAYELRYTLRGGDVRVTVRNVPDLENPRERFAMTVQEAQQEPRSFAWSAAKSGQIRDWLPRHVFAYYSGPSDRLEEHFREHQKLFYKALLRGEEKPLRPLFYARPVHSNFVLLAFYMKPDPVVQQFLKETLLIEGLDSVLFVFRKPGWPGDKKNGDPRFWYATGTVQKFLADVYQASLAPMRVPGRLSRGLESTERTEFQYHYLRDLLALQELATQSPNAAEFFKKLESTYINDLIHETRIRVKVRNCDGSLTFRELSEGEQQLLMVVGLLRFTKEEESLFLLDEPDTHLNPTWGMEYLRILKTIAEPGNDSQVLLATHDPLVIAGLRKEQVIVLERDESSGRVTAKHPDVDPMGLGVSGVLRSEMFGLPSLIASSVQEALDRRFALMTKGEPLSDSEKIELDDLNHRMAPMELAADFRDENFRIVAVGLARARAEMEGRLTPERRKTLEEGVTKAARKLFAGRRT